MNDVGINITGSTGNAEFKYVFEHPVAGARAFIGHIKGLVEDEILNQVTTNSWVVFQGVGEPAVNPLMPTQTYQQKGIWVCQNDKVGEAIIQAMNAGKEFGFTLFCGDVEEILMVEKSRTSRYVLS